MPQTLAKQFIRACIPRNVRDWLRSPSKSIQWVWGDFKNALGITQTVQIREGWSLKCHPGAYKFAYWAQENDQDQVEEFDGFISSCHSEMVIFDVGAHFGLFSLAALHYGGSSAKAIAIDPSSTAIRIMKVQAKLNNVDDRMLLIRASVGDQIGWQNMVTVGVHSGGYLVAANSDHTAGELTKMKVVTIDKLVQELKLFPTHIKIDVEGNEADVLRGSREVLTQANPPLLFIELHNKIISENGGDPEGTLTLLNDLKYKTFTPNGLPIEHPSILKKPLIRIVAKRIA